MKNTRMPALLRSAFCFTARLLRPGQWCLWWMWPLFLLGVGLPSMALADDGGLQVPVLLYHKFDVETKQFTTVRDATLEQQLQELSTHGYQVIPLRDLVDYMLGKRDALPAKAVAITVDDGYRSVYDVLFPLLQRYHMPVTLFIYPAAISKDSWALSWEQLKTMQQSGLVDIEVHTYTHPNFALEKLQMSSQAYREFVHVELTLSKQLLEEHMGKSMDMIAWPFGYTDDVLLQEARNDGYQAAFSIDSLPVTQHSLMFQLPRIMMFERYDAKTFENTLRKITMSEEIRRHSETLPARMTNISY